MKHIVSILSVILCFACVLLAFPAEALNNQANVTVNKGETVEIIVTIPERISAKAGSIEINYGNEFKYISGDWSLANTTIKRYTANDKKGVFTFDGERSIVGSVFVIKLKLSDNISIGKHSISYLIKLRNAKGETCDFSDTYTVLVVGNHILGDVDDDGVVTIIDATVIQRYLSCLPIKRFNESIADTDGDGKITNLDVTLVQRFLAELSVNNKIGKEVQ